MVNLPGRAAWWGATLPPSFSAVAISWVSLRWCHGNLFTISWGIFMENSWKFNGNSFRHHAIYIMGHIGTGKSHLLGACRLLVAKLGLLAGQGPPWEHNLTHDWHFIHAITEINEYIYILYCIILYIIYIYYILYVIYYILNIIYYILYVIYYILYIIYCILYIIYYILCIIYYFLNYILYYIYNI